MLLPRRRALFRERDNSVRERAAAVFCASAPFAVVRAPNARRLACRPSECCREVLDGGKAHFQRDGREGLPRVLQQLPGALDLNGLLLDPEAGAACRQSPLERARRYTAASSDLLE